MIQRYLFGRATEACTRWRGSVAKILSSVLLGLVVLTGCSGQSQTPVAQNRPAQASATPAASTDSLRGLVALALRRIVLGDQVSAAKFGTPSPIDDPPREQQVLEAVRASANRAGVAPDEAVRFFQNQITASKVVQRGLYQLWTEHPEQAPKTRPDLRTQVRPELDAITTQLIDQLRATGALRHDAACSSALAAELAQASGPLDQLHRDALNTALRDVCVRR